MMLLMWLRALLDMNFYNWNCPLKRNSYGVVLIHLQEHPDFNVGQKYEITAVNRTTGRIEILPL